MKETIDWFSWDYYEMNVTSSQREELISFVARASRMPAYFKTQTPSANKNTPLDGLPHRQQLGPDIAGVSARITVLEWRPSHLQNLAQVESSAVQCTAVQCTAVQWRSPFICHMCHNLDWCEVWVKSASPKDDFSIFMISEQYRCIFVEVPKTGSTSIRSIVGEPLRPHLNIWQIAQGMVPEQFEQFYKFGFVRNPWDRAVALYERREGMQLKSKLSFEEFIDWMKFASSTCLHPVPHRYQLDWFVNPHGDIIVNRIGRFENLANDWAEIASRIGARPDLPMLNVNTNRKRHYSEYFSKRSRLIVETRFAVDIEYFGYKFEG